MWWLYYIRWLCIVFLLLVIECSFVYLCTKKTLFNGEMSVLLRCGVCRLGIVIYVHMTNMGIYAVLYICGTPVGLGELSVIEKCPYYRGGVCLKFGSLWPHSGRTVGNSKVSAKRGATGKSHGKAIFYVLPKELSHTTCTFLNIILAWNRKSRFCWAKQRNRQSRMLWITELPRSTIGVGWLFSLSSSGI